MEFIKRNALGSRLFVGPVDTCHTAYLKRKVLLHRQPLFEKTVVSPCGDRTSPYTFIYIVSTLSSFAQN